nr:sensor histidine kinase [Rhizobium sp. Khangiran2]
MAPQAVARNIDLGLEVEPGLDARVGGNADLLAAMLRNLVDNALRYIPEGAWVSVRLARSEGNLLLRVEDSGRHSTGAARTGLASLRPGRRQRHLRKRPGIGNYCGDRRKPSWKLYVRRTSRWVGTDCRRFSALVEDARREQSEQPGPTCLIRWRSQDNPIPAGHRISLWLCQVPWQTRCRLFTCVSRPGHIRADRNSLRDRHLNVRLTMMLPETRQAELVKSFGRQQAYEGPRGRNPRTTGGGYGDSIYG